MSDYNIPKIIHGSKTNQNFHSKITALTYGEFTPYNLILEDISNITTTQKCIAFLSKIVQFYPGLC